MDNTELAKRIAEGMIAQNNAILDVIAHPEKMKLPYGYCEDSWGRPYFVDHIGNAHRLENPDNLNGWTI